MSWEIDTDRFAADVAAKRGTRSIAGAAKEADVSNSAIFRATDRENISAANFLAICRWLGKDPMRYLRSVQ